MTNEIDSKCGNNAQREMSPGSMERPRICSVDLPKETTDALKKSGYFVYQGSLGFIVRVHNNERGQGVNLIPDPTFPANFHEYDLSIVDLTNISEKAYKPEEHRYVSTKGQEVMRFVCRYPTTLFDPRPLAASHFPLFDTNMERPFIQIVFACENYSVEYLPVVIAADHSRTENTVRAGIYDFWENLPLDKTRTGTEVAVCSADPQVTTFLNRYKKEFEYKQTFHHVRKWISSVKTVDDPDFVPLLRNINGDIIGFSWKQGNLLSFVFPNVKRKTDFVSEFLRDIAMVAVPELFPYSTQFKWIDDPEYFVGSHLSLLQEKEETRKKFEAATAVINGKIAQNKAQWDFLHKLLTETGDALVWAVQAYLRWLGFNKVEIKSERVNGVLEEDIEITLDNGIILLEVKGIGGTSTDSDCAQIQKIRRRREKQRGFDVTAIYLVNHQRHMPPGKRTVPPFTKHQLEDAENDERGLVTTWQLFQAFRDIESGVFTKEEARLAFVRPGLVIFRPVTKHCLGTPKEIFNQGSVAILDIHGCKIRKGQTLIAEKDGRFRKVEIKSIQVNGAEIPEVENGEIGIKLSDRLDLSTQLWSTE